MISTFSIWSSVFQPPKVSLAAWGSPKLQYVDKIDLYQLVHLPLKICTNPQPVSMAIFKYLMLSSTVIRATWLCRRTPRSSIQTSLTPKLPVSPFSCLARIQQFPSINFTDKRLVYLSLCWPLPAPPTLHKPPLSHPPDDLIQTRPAIPDLEWSDRQRLPWCWSRVYWVARVHQAGYKNKSVIKCEIAGICLY